MTKAYAPLLSCLVLSLLAVGSVRPASAAAPPAEEGPSDPEDLEAFVDGFFTERMEAHDVPGAAFVLVEDGEIVLAKGYGYADLEGQVPVDPRTTVFRIGSGTKLFTATAVMQLVEEGKIDLHADVNRYLERFQIPDTYPEPVTMAHLLTHTAGFDDKLIGAFDRSVSELRPLGEYLAEEMPARVMPPGQVPSYSNHGMALAGYIVEVVSGVPYETYVQERILEPLGMERSSSAQPLPPALAADRAVPYPRGEEPGALVYMPIAPAGMLSTTAHDMARFLIAHLEEGRYGDARILERETAQTMHRLHVTRHPGLPGWAYGFTRRLENGQHVLDHGGADPTGYGSMTVLLPEENLGFFAVTNARFQEDLLLAFPEAFLDRYYPDEDLLPEEPEPLSHTEQRVEEVAGTYLTTRHARHSIAKLSLLSQPPVRVRPVEGEPGVVTVSGLGHGEAEGPSRWVEIEPLLFQRQGSEERIAFGTQKDGRVTHLFARQRTPGAFDKAAWYQTPAFHQLLVGACLLIFLTAAVGMPLAGPIRRLLGRPTALAPAVRQARWLAFGVGVLNLLFMVLVTTLTSVYPLQFGVPLGLKALFVVPLLTTAMAIALPVLGVRAWSAAWPTLGRVHYALVTLASFAFIWFLTVWNLLGFRF